MPTTAVVEAATVLREELRPPQYGTQFISEDASRTFYTKYLEYKRCVEPVSYTHLTLPTILLV